MQGNEEHVGGTPHEDFRLVPALIVASVAIFSALAVIFGDMETVMLTGLVGGAGVSMAAIMWYQGRKEVRENGE